RLTNVHVRPAPETVNVWDPVVGPSDAAKATSTSPAAAVLNADVVRAPDPSEKTTLSTTTAAVQGPVDNVRFTALPGCAVEPPAGLCETTDPDGTVALDTRVSVPTTSPAFVIDVVAAACVELTTLGTRTGGGPDDTVRLTELPEVTLVSAAGL